MTLCFSFLSLLPNSLKIFLFLKTQLLKSLHGYLQIFLCSILKKLNSYLLVFPQQHSKMENFLSPVSMTPTVTLSSPSSAPNLGVLFDSNLSPSDSDHISSIIKSCLLHVKDHASDLFLTKPLLAILQRIRSNSF